MKKKIIGYSIFFVVLTALFFVFVFAGTDNWKTKSPVLSYVRPFSFTTQNGLPFTNTNMLGKVCVVNYFFTSCKGICPHMNNNLKNIYDEFKNEKDFMIVSHTSDPETDSAARLKHYADSLKVDSNKWVFLTGRKDSLYQAARNSYLLDDPKNNVEKIEDQFLHTQFIALIDKKGQVRGQIYDGLKKDDLTQLKKDIKDLLNE
ncbi:MAG: SCO family protein [Chitinophagaceae bacterium]